ncbi:MAG: hypothetical protein L3J84_06025 [Gammaproteobacteria bacterium]|nr:hypothetical protein [Gammaproteobacteria bacterium]
MAHEQNTSGRRCTLVLPGLLDLPPAERESVFAQVGRLPELECFFSRAQKHRFSGASFEAVLFALFDVRIPTDVDLPVAAVGYMGDTGQSATGWCLRADPVQLIPDRDHLVLMGPESLSLSQAEADLLVADLNAQFAQDGWHIEAATPTRWYLHQSDTPRLRTYDLTQVRGRAIGEYLPGGADGKQWHRLMNEVQMVLHISAVNQRRQTAGQPPVSSLWFWGGGETPAIPSGNTDSQWSQVWSNEPVSQGLVALSNIANTARKGLPENAATWLSAAHSPGKHLLVLDDLLRCWQNGEMEGWVQWVRAFNREWMLPLLNALRRNEIDELSLYACNGNQFTLSRTGLRRWWRRKKALSVIAARV